VFEATIGVRVKAAPEYREMKPFTYTQARQDLAKILRLANNEEIEIRRRDGSVYSLKSNAKMQESTFDIPGINTPATDIGLTIHPDPTQSETVAMAAEMFDGTITDMLVPKR